MTDLCAIMLRKVPVDVRRTLKIAAATAGEGLEQYIVKAALARAEADAQAQAAGRGDPGR